MPYGQNPENCWNLATPGGAPRDLSWFTDDELQKASAWTVVTSDPNGLHEVLKHLEVQSVQDRTALFGDRLQVSVLEVHLQRPNDYQQLHELFYSIFHQSSVNLFKIRYLEILLKINQLLLNFR